MSWRRTTILICNGLRCQPTEPEVAGPLGGAYLSFAGTAPLAAVRRSAATEFKWTYDKATNADLCPRCQARHICHWCQIQGTDRPAYRLFTGTCQHGHARTFPLCDADAAAAVRIPRICVDCAQHPDSHQCRITITEAPDPAADTSLTDPPPPQRSQPTP